MFPLTNKEPYIKSSGERTTLGDMFSDTGHDISQLEHDVEQLNEALTDEVETRTSLGAHQLIPLSLETIKSANQSGTWVGNVYTPTSAPNMTFTVNSDMSITIAGTNSSSVLVFLLLDVSDPVIPTFSNCILSGNPCDASEAILQLQEYTGSWINYGYVYDNEELVIPTITTAKNRFHIQVFANKTVNATIKPLIRLSTDTDPTYQPYAMTNKVLTDNKIDASQIAPIENGATASTSYAQGAFFIHNGKFCKAKTSIASGATFTKDTNYEETTVAAELIALA